MNGKKIAINAENVVIPRDDYIEYCVFVRDMRQFVENIDCFGDELFQAAVLKEALYLMTRSFAPIDYLKE